MIEAVHLGKLKRVIIGHDGSAQGESLMVYRSGYGILEWEKVGGSG